MTGLLTSSKFRRVGLDELTQCPIPPGTNTYEPILHGWLFNEVCRQVTKRGYSVDSCDLRITPSGDEFFGILRLCSPSTGSCQTRNSWDLSLGIRNTNNKRASAGIFLGTNVWVCDNLMFSADYTLLRKHHVGSYDVLQMGIEEITRHLNEYHADQRDLVSNLQNWMLNPSLRSHILVNCLRKGAIKGNDIIPILNEVEKPDVNNPEAKSDSAWGLFNAITWIGKKGFNRNPETAAMRSLSLSKVFQYSLISID